MAVFSDRAEAGDLLARRLQRHRGRKGLIVLALPRGGVVVGAAVACSLSAPLDVFIVRKIGFPGQPEFAAGAVAETGVRVMNTRILSAYDVPAEYVEREASRQEEEAKRGALAYREGRTLPPLSGRPVILVDDGVATGSTIKAAITTLRKEQLQLLVVAVPVAPPDAASSLAAMADEFICLFTPGDFMAVGAYYGDFAQVPDEEVVRLLKEARIDATRAGA